MLLEQAIGDAYGAGFEYVGANVVEKYNDLSRYVVHKWHDLTPGNYTDDTQMSIALAELIISGKEWTSLNTAEKFVEVFKRDPRKGYSKGFYKFLCQVNDGKQFLEEIIAKSDKNGAAMRAPVIGIYPEISEVIERSTIQAKITHDTPDGINAAVASSLMTHYCIYSPGSKKDLGIFLAEHVPGDWIIEWDGEVGSKGLDTVQAAVTAVILNDSLSSVLKTCVNFTGDTDTVASIAMSAAACSKEIENDLPGHLFEGLENGKFGKDYIIKLDEELSNLFK